MKNKIFIWFCVLFVPFILILSYISVVFSYDYNGEQQEVINYLSGKGELSEELIGKEFSEKEKEHLEDVKKVMNGFNVLFYLLLIILIILGIFLFKRNELGHGLINGGVWSAVFLAVFLIIIFIDFENSFNVFHQIFFPQGNWQFESGSRLITLFSADFFAGITKRILMNAALFVFVFVLSGYVIKKAE